MTGDGAMRVWKRAVTPVWERARRNPTSSEVALAVDVLGELRMLILGVSLREENGVLTEITRDWIALRTLIGLRPMREEGLPAGGEA